MKRTILFATLFALVGCVQAKDNQIKPISTEQRVPSTIIKRVDEDIKKEKIRRENETKRKLEKESKKLDSNIDKINKNIVKVKDVKEHKQVKQTSRSEGTYIDLGVFTVTSYSLFKSDCGKSKNDKGYGITKTGYNLRNKSRLQAKTIAVDPRVIPLGSKVYIEFKEKDYSKYNGYYFCRDTGSAIKGKKVDLFLGDLTNKQILIDFGKVKASVKLIR